MLSLKNALRARSEHERRLDHRLRSAEERLANPPISETPREVAIDWIRSKIRDQKAGLDVFDPSIFVLVCGRFEKLWAFTTLELVGTVLARTDQPGGGQRIRAILEADARIALDLDGASPSWMLDEPLASRSVESTHGRMELLLGGLDPERESSAAIKAAHRAYEGRTHS